MDRDLGMDVAWRERFDAIVAEPDKRRIFSRAADLRIGRSCGRSAGRIDLLVALRSYVEQHDEGVAMIARLCLWANPAWRSPCRRR